LDRGGGTDVVGPANGHAVVRIDFVFDTVCPWCYIGKRRFERALAQRPHAHARIYWRPFLLNPDLPALGVDHRTFMERKFGGSTRVQRMLNAATLAGRTEGIDFAFDRIARVPNTIQSHRLVRFATQWGCAAEVLEAIYHAYFHDGRDIGDVDELIAIGAEQGLSAQDLSAHLLSDDDRFSLLGENTRSHRLGINGVPCLILDGLYALAGAQEPDILLRLLDIAQESEAEVRVS
jgi:predicted DsbA family dithiol-disulfide isomerase